MENIIYQLYKDYYTPPPRVNTPESKRIEQNHHALIGRLGKAERKLVLRVIDDKDTLIERQTFNAFACGFRLAMELSTEINDKGGHTTEANRGE